jgi:aspartyl-tRNA synthetase
VFLDLRDRDGLVQVSFDPAWADDATRRAAAAVGVESVVLVDGEVAERPADRRNAEMATGDVEVRATAIRVVGPADTPVIPVARGRGEKLPAEDLRLRYRYLDLRRPELQQSLMLRHRLAQRTRRYLSDRGFLELGDADPHEADARGRARLPRAEPRAPGEFYALPQSPQIYKQLFMMAGSTATSRSRAASATRTCAPTVNPSSRRST